MPISRPTVLRPAAVDGSSTARDFTVDVALRLDTLTCIMLTMVTFISLLVAIYSVGYMHADRGYWRFFAYIALFVFSMTMLVSVSNFLLLFVFWEAVGVCSYLLIGFWYEKPSAAAAGKKAFLVNRVGDFGFMLGVFLIWTTYGTLNYHDTPLAPGTVVVREDVSLAAAAPAASRWQVCLGLSASLPTPMWVAEPGWPSACCCCSVRAARALSSRCTCGCPTRWKVRRRSAR